MDIKIERMTITNIEQDTCCSWPTKSEYKFSIHLNNGQTLHVCKNKIYIEEFVSDIEGEGKYYNRYLEGYIYPIMEYDLITNDFKLD